MPISDLTNTTWVLNSSVSWWSSIDFSSKWFYIDFTSNNNNYNELDFDSFNGEDENGEFFQQYLVYRNNITHNDAYVFYEISPYTDEILHFNPYNYYNDAYRTITITGGTDATNTDLINWLSANAVQQITPTVNTTSSFSDIALTSHEGYITLTIDNVDFNINATAVVNNNESNNEVETGYTVGLSVDENVTTYMPSGEYDIYDGQNEQGTKVATLIISSMNGGSIKAPVIPVDSKIATLSEEEVTISSGCIYIDSGESANYILYFGINSADSNPYEVTEDVELTIFAVNGGAMA